MERGGDVGAFCWIRPSANHIQICVVCCIVPLSSRKLSSQNLSGAFGFPTTSHHSSSAETKEKTKETVSAGVWGHRAFQASQGPACKLVEPCTIGSSKEIIRQAGIWLATTQDIYVIVSSPSGRELSKWANKDNPKAMHLAKTLEFFKSSVVWSLKKCRGTGFVLALDLYDFVRYSNIVVGIVDAWKSHKVFTMTDVFLKLKQSQFRCRCQHASWNQSLRGEPLHCDLRHVQLMLVKDVWRSWKCWKHTP